MYGGKLNEQDDLILKDEEEKWWWLLNFFISSPVISPWLLLPLRLLETNGLSKFKKHLHHILHLEIVIARLARQVGRSGKVGWGGDEVGSEKLSGDERGR